MPTLRAGLRPALALAGALVAAACAPQLGPGVQGTIDVSDGRPALELTYLGSGGWIMSAGAEQVVAATALHQPVVSCGRASWRSSPTRS